MSGGSWKAVAKEAWKKTLLVANFFCALHVTTTYLCTPVHVMGPSMVPTFNLTGDMVLVERLSPRFGKVRPGDVILYRSPVKPWEVVTKRLIGLEGDTITYLVEPDKGDQVETLVVPQGHIWAQGDNIYKSRDSRTYGPVPYGLLWGRAIWKVSMLLLSFNFVRMDLLNFLYKSSGLSQGILAGDCLIAEWIDGSALGFFRVFKAIDVLMVGNQSRSSRTSRITQLVGELVLFHKM